MTQEPGSDWRAPAGIGSPRPAAPSSGSWSLGLPGTLTPLPRRASRRGFGGCRPTAFREELSPLRLPPGWDHPSAVRGGAEAGREGGASGPGARREAHGTRGGHRVSSGGSLEGGARRFFPSRCLGFSRPRCRRGRFIGKRGWADPGTETRVLLSPGRCVPWGAGDTGRPGALLAAALESGLCCRGGERGVPRTQSSRGQAG